MKLTPYFISLFFSFLLVSTSFSDITEVETAIMKEDFVLSKKLATDVLHYAVVKKDTAFVAKYYLGLSHLRLEEYSKSAKVFKNLIRHDPPAEIRDKAFIGLIECYYQQEKYKASRKALKKLLQLSPQSEFLSLIYLKGARINLKLTEWDEAKWYIKQIIENFPDSFEYNIALQLLEEKQYFAVQIGAFVDRARAEQMVEVLKNENHYAYIVETTDRNNIKFYRVRVGQISILEDAEHLKSKLTKLGYPASIYP